jgi:hypothetical protein
MQLVDLFRSYFEGALNENSVKRNFVLIYELLDETMDFGFPQLTEPAALKSFIMQKGVRSEVDVVRAEEARQFAYTVHPHQALLCSTSRAAEVHNLVKAITTRGVTTTMMCSTAAVASA